MKSMILVALFAAVASAAVVSVDPKDAVVVRYDNDNIGVGPYAYGYETSDGKFAQEQGQLENVGTEAEGIEVRGQFSYTAPDGVVYSVTYTAGKEGFKPVGAHLPVAPVA